jgi:hypothetical protein
MTQPNEQQQSFGEPTVHGITHNDSFGVGVDDIITPSAEPPVNPLANLQIITVPPFPPPDVSPPTMDSLPPDVRLPPDPVLATGLTPKMKGLSVNPLERGDDRRYFFESDMDPDFTRERKGEHLRQGIRGAFRLQFMRDKRNKLRQPEVFRTRGSKEISKPEHHHELDEEYNAPPKPFPKALRKQTRIWKPAPIPTIRGTPHIPPQA